MTEKPVETQAQVTTKTPSAGLVVKFASKYEVAADKLLETLKLTCFKTKEPINNAQMMALLVVADQYNLNPFTREIFAYPDKVGIVPVVGVDGWSRIINDNPMMDGIEFVYSPDTKDHKGKIVHEWIDCIIYRKDRSVPTKVREYFDEVVRIVNFSTPWDSHPHRMHRHKTLIQCARIAFGFGGIYDEDEAARIKDSIKAAPPTQAAQDTLDALNGKEVQPIDVSFEEVKTFTENDDTVHENESLQKVPVCSKCNGKGCISDDEGVTPCECQAQGPK